MALKRAHNLFTDVIDDGKHYYKRKFVCWKCRLMFRPHWRNRMDTPSPNGPHMSPDHMLMETCPSCSGDLYHVGFQFRPPRRENVREWARLEKRMAG